MDLVARLAGAFVGVVLLVSGIAKLGDRGSVATAAHGLGVPRWLVVPVPMVEVAIGALLVAGAVPPWPALAAGALLGAFTAVLVVRLVQGRRPACRCFGARSTRPISWWSVVRNAVLLAGCALAAAGWR